MGAGKGQVGWTGLVVHMGMCVMHVCVETRGQLPQELSALFLEMGSPPGVHDSLIRIGWQAPDLLSHLPTFKSLSLILSDAREIKEDPEDQFSPLGF